MQKSKTLALGRLATLSAIKENLRVKTSFQKNEATTPQASSDIPNAHTNGGDGDSVLLFSAISSYKEKTPRYTPTLSSDHFAAAHETASPTIRSSPLQNRFEARMAAVENGGGQGDSNRDIFDPVITDSRFSASAVPGREAEEDSNGEGESHRGEIISTTRDLEEEDLEEMWQFPPKVSGLGLDRRDLLTEDKWVPRHPDLIRVQGFHPFNGEPPLSTLMHFGFLTPTSLHYVRNRGPVPRAGWESWIIEITGLMSKPKKFTMRDLLCFPSRRLPVTLTCSGNRSKELSNTGKSVGLNWGPGAVSTSVWGGARLCDVLRHCGVHLPKKRGVQYFVCLQGADKLDGGKKAAPGSLQYGTSIPLEVAMDESRDILLAYEQNGDLLTPDHGFPVRLIVPGFTGARSVKWLNRIEISAEQSDNYYHIHDSRMLPSQVPDLETAVSEGWLSRPEFVINEMNVNSVICTPAHGQVLAVDPSNPTASFSVTGYAYSGTGKKISRVEVSLDGGKTWKFCSVGYPAQPTKYGMYWCWCFWEARVGVQDLVNSVEIVVRAWDAAMNTQPENSSWNLMGTMNNCWYRVKVSHENSGKGQDKPTMLTFDHPTQPGDLSGGWQQTSGATEPELEQALSIKLLHQDSTPLDFEGQLLATPQLV